MHVSCARSINETLFKDLLILIILCCLKAVVFSIKSSLTRVIGECLLGCKIYLKLLGIAIYKTIEVLERHWKTRDNF